MEPQDNSTEIENENIAFTDSEIFTEIWASPRLVFRYIHENHYEKFLYVLLALGGIIRAFDRASVKGVGDQFSLTTIILLCVLTGGAVGWITYYIYAAMLSWTYPVGASLPALAMCARETCAFHACSLQTAETRLISHPSTSQACWHS